MPIDVPVTFDAHRPGVDDVPKYTSYACAFAQLLQARVGLVLTPVASLAGEGLDGVEGGDVIGCV